MRQARRFWKLGATGALLLLVSCPNPLMSAILAKEAIDTSKTLSVFSFTASANASLYRDVAGTVNTTAHTIALSVPKWVPLTNLIATFQFQGANVTVGSAVQTSGVTANDYTHPVTYTVTPASGSPVTYTVTATTGPQGLMGGAIQGMPLSLSGVVSTVSGQASSFGNPAGVVNVGSYLYVADTQFSVIWRVDVSSGATTLFAGILGNPGYADQAGGPATSAKFNGPVGLATDGTYLYVADTFTDRIRKIDIVNGYVTTLTGTGAAGHADGAAGTATLDAPTGLVYDSVSSSLYETDKTSGIVRQITLAGAVTTLTPYPSTTLLSPVAVVKYGTNLYVADEGNHALYSLLASGSTPTVLSGNAGTSGYTDGVGSSAYYNTPTGIAVNGTHLYVADSLNHVIREVDPTNGNVTTYLGVGTQSGYIDASGATNMMFNTPNNLCVVSGSTNNMYLTETGNLTVRDVKLASTPFSATLAGVGPGTANGISTAVRFNSPRHMATNGSSIWLSDQLNQVIRSFDTGTEIVSTPAGQAGVINEQDGTGGSAQFNYPAGVTTDGKYLYISDSYGQTIRKMSLATSQVTTIAGSSNQAGLVDGAGKVARFQRPSGITTDGKNLYVSDLLNNAIRKVDLGTFQVTTIAGSLTGASGDADGTGTSATFNNPIGITTDGTNLYVADNNNRKIRQIVIGTWVVSTFAGPLPGSQAAGYANGAAHSALFRAPWGITTDGTSLYVTDFNYVVRKIDIATGTVSTLVGAAPALVADGETDGTGAAARFNKDGGITTDGTSLYVLDNGSNTLRQIR